MDTSTATEVSAFMEEYNKHYEAFIIFLSTKMSKVMADDLYWLSESLGDEQAMIMKGQSLEQKRLALFQRVGLKDYTVEMLLKECPEECKSKLTLECHKFNDYIIQVQKLNSEILDTVERKLKFQADLVRKTGLAPAETYNGYGTKIKTTTGGGGIIGSV